VPLGAVAGGAHDLEMTTGRCDKTRVQFNMSWRYTTESPNQRLPEQMGSKTSAAPACTPNFADDIERELDERVSRRSCQ